MAELSVHWQNTTGATVNQDQIEQHLLAVLRRLKAVGKVGVEVSLVTDKEIKALKQRFLGINAPTDVLSFPYDGQIAGLVGSIVVSVDTASKQAATAGIALIDELKMLVNHGLLHLLGYNHR